MTKRRPSARRGRRVLATFLASERRFELQTAVVPLVRLGGRECGLRSMRCCEPVRRPASGVQCWRAAYHSDQGQVSSGPWLVALADDAPREPTTTT
jgi:hypothetical protein